MEEKKIEEGVPSKEEIKEVSPKTTRKTTKKTSTKTKTSGKPKSQNVEVISLDLNDDGRMSERYFINISPDFTLLLLFIT